MAVSYKRLWKLLIDKDIEESRSGAQSRDHALCPEQTHPEQGRLHRSSGQNLRGAGLHN